MEFKKGDKVKRIHHENFGTVKDGEIYTVLKTGKHWIKIEEDEGNSTYSIEYFELANKNEVKKMKEKTKQIHFIVLKTSCMNYEAVFTIDSRESGVEYFKNGYGKGYELHELNKDSLRARATLVIKEYNKPKRKYKKR